MDKIFLNDLKIDTVIGVFDWERQIQQTLTFDLEIDWDIHLASAEDDINHTLDYGVMAQTIVSFVKENHFHLIETLAEEVAMMLLKKFAMPKLKLSLSKPVAVYGQNIARVVIERSQEDVEK